ncbi:MULTISPECIES: hypothetical protein [Paraburkholderia]|uniref:Lipoprotein n=1 Tax=Paraburkholderia podalyriae TaxID=1938811 RepID=A0ABR7PJ63_9BURK|nr:hypothetical protein [Paraburkholderia podalyriae]MBC8746412.1 hypothetical protein [Paraburkholderia podalyriae]
MKWIVAVTSAIFVIAGTCAFAQTGAGNANTGNQATQSPQPGTAGQSMGRAADVGGKPASGTLMQKREKGMSPQGASDTNATGKIKQ